jgi:hypothetical protein
MALDPPVMKSVEEWIQIPDWDQRGISERYAVLANYDKASEYIDPAILQMQQLGFDRISMTQILPGGAYDFGSGTVSAPGIRWAADTNTGFYWTTDGSFHVSANGSQVATFNTSGLRLNNLTQARVLLAGASGQIVDDSGLTFSDIADILIVAGGVRIGTATDTPGTGDFAAGLTGASRIVFDQGSQSFRLYDSGGTEDFRVNVAGTSYYNGTGNWGFGTTSPDRKVEIVDATNPQLRLTQFDSTTYTDLKATSTGVFLVETTAGITLFEQFPATSGGDIELWVGNYDDAGGHSILKIRNYDDAAGDAKIEFRTGTASSYWSLGHDNSTNNFVISRGQALGTTDGLIIDTSRNVYFPAYTQGSALFIGASGQVSQDNTNFNWNDSTNLLKIGQSTSSYTALGTSHIYAEGTTVHSIANVFAEFGEGRPLGNPTGTVTAVVGAAGALTGAYKYAYYEKDVDGNSTGLSPVSATVNPAAQRVTVTIPRARTGVASRVLCRTVAGGSTYFVLATFGPSYEFHQTVYNDNQVDGLLGAAAPSTDTSVVYKCSIRRGETFFVAHPDQAGSTHDVGLLTGNPNAAGEWALDSYGSIVARQSLGTNFYSVHTGTAGYHILCDYNSEEYGSAVASPFIVLPRGDLVMAPVAYTSGLPIALTLTTPAHTGLTASSEDPSAYFNLSATKTWATGALTLQRELLVAAPTLAFAGASTVTSAVSLAVTGPPLAGTNATLTNSYGITVGTPEAASLSGEKTLGLFAAGNAFAIIRNTTDNIEVFWGADASDTYIGSRTNHAFRLQSNATTRLIIGNSGESTFGATATVGANLGRVLNVEAAAPGMTFYETDAAADEKGWDWFFNGGLMQFRSFNDAINAATVLIQADRVGNTFDYLGFFNASVLIGNAVLATTATDGFLYIPTCAGTPTGVPTARTGVAPLVINTTNNKLYFYSGGAWRDAGP